MTSMMYNLWGQSARFEIKQRPGFRVFIHAQTQYSAFFIHFYISQPNFYLISNCSLKIKKNVLQLHLVCKIYSNYYTP